MQNTTARGMAAICICGRGSQGPLSTLAAGFAASKNARCLAPCQNQSLHLGNRGANGSLGDANRVRLAQCERERVKSESESTLTPTSALLACQVRLENAQPV